MVNERIIIYLQDVLDAIRDVETCFEGYPNRFDLFEKDIMRRCVVERKAEIMGEAINRIRKTDPTIVIPNSHAIIAPRNRIIHAYDNVHPEFLWSLVTRHFTELKQDILKLFAQYGIDPYVE